jgi:hypothetical protein
MSAIWGDDQDPEASSARNRKIQTLGRMLQVVGGEKNVCRMVGGDRYE